MKALIVDDEKHSRHVMSLLLARYCPEIKVMAQCANAAEALVAISTHQPELVFLDIEMPGINGFTMLEKCDDRNFDVIFTTAYNEYAIQAIRHSALDYLLKPVDKDELIKAVARVRKNKRLMASERVDKLLQMLNMKKTIEQVALPTMEGLVMINTDDIVYCESDSAYTNFIFTDGKKILSAKTLKEVEDVLVTKNFYRVHNSFLINLRYIKKYIKGAGGEVVMINGSHIPISRTKKQEFLSMLEKI
jgi:two-component system LytT family response regulator